MTADVIDMFTKAKVSDGAPSAPAVATTEQDSVLKKMAGLLSKLDAEGGMKYDSAIVIMGVEDDGSGNPGMQIASLGLSGPRGIGFVAMAQRALEDRALK